MKVQHVEEIKNGQELKTLESNHGPHDSGKTFLSTLFANLYQRFLQHL